MKCSHVDPFNSTGGIKEDIFPIKNFLNKQAKKQNKPADIKSASLWLNQLG